MVLFNHGKGIPNLKGETKNDDNYERICKRNYYDST